MTEPLWTILIATIGRRRDSFTRVTTKLLDQTRPYDGAVTVIALWNNGERPLAEVRQALVESATARYVSFVDDDDDVPDYHVSEVVRGLTSAEPPDQVGWRMQCYADGVALKPTFHSIQYGRWHEDSTAYYRDVSHLNPVRTQLARRCDFRDGDPPEDVSWVQQLRPHVRTEYYISKIMYHYHSSASDSTWRPGSVRDVGYARAEITDPNFTWHPWSLARDEVSA